jgi:hypothetical protein
VTQLRHRLCIAVFETMLVCAEGEVTSWVPPRPCRDPLVAAAIMQSLAAQGLRGARSCSVAKQLKYFLGAFLVPAGHTSSDLGLNNQAQTVTSQFPYQPCVVSLW